MVARLITKIVSWAVGVFYDVERVGPLLPDGPVLVTANHPNALVDPLIVFRTGGRPSRPLAKAPLFDQALMGTVLRGLGGLPLYRKQDDPALMHKNDTTFAAAIAALHNGEAVQIYPEGYSHSLPSLSPIRTGAARIATQAEEEREWGLGLMIQPVGLTYTRKHLFRGRVVAAFGRPFPVADYAAAFRVDERAAVRALTSRIRTALEDLTLNYEDPEDAELVEVAERLYARHKGLVRWRERDRMAERFPRLQAFAKGIRWLHAVDPERLKRLRGSVRLYLRMLTLFGAKEGDVPPVYRTGVVLRYSILRLAELVLGLPIALIGAAAWGVPFVFTRHVAPRFRPKLDQVATYKLSVALLIFPIWYVVLALIVVATLGVGLAGVAVMTALPIVGLVAVGWKQRQAQSREDLRVFLRTMANRKSRDRLAEQRLYLVGEFDALADAWAARRTEMGVKPGPRPSET